MNGKVGKMATKYEDSTGVLFASIPSPKQFTNQAV